MKINSLLAAILVLLFVNYSQAQRQEIQNFKAYDQTNVNVFEGEKDTETPYTGMKLRIGGSFTQQFQSITHSTKSDTSFGVLEDIGSGFNLATANLNIDAQLADGVILNLQTYLSSRHHPEAWVKGGYLQVDKLSFLKSDALNNFFNDRFRLKVGHMEINYGDQHFRRTDNGNAMFNPFVGNYMLDAFTTEIGGELYYFQNGFMGMFGMTNGLINGNVTNPGKRSPSIYGKLAYDSEINDDLRIRVAGSAYYNGGTTRNTLFWGDRTGSRYYLVMEAAGSSTAAQAWSGRFNPDVASELTAIQGNVFVKFKGAELFGTYETVSGKGNGDVNLRTTNQIGADLIYRFLEDEKMYVAARYNTLTGRRAYDTNDKTWNRIQAGMGWFVTPNVLAKIEYVNQDYSGYAANTSFFHGGNFNGIMIEGVIGF